MPKTAPYRLTWDLKQGAYSVHDMRNHQVLAVAPDSPAWFEWLRHIPSFAFSGQHGHLTLRQESRSGGAYWYAYQRVGEKMTKRYLGHSATLTLAHLELVATQLAKAALSLSQDTRDTEETCGAASDHSVMPSPGAFLLNMTLAHTAVPAPPERLPDTQFSAKLHIPHLRTQLVQRDRLIQLLQQGRDAPLTLISAPAGFGKTTLLAQWLTASDRPAAWVSLESADNDPVHFLFAVIAALQQLDPHLGNTIRALFPAPSLGPPPHPEVVIDRLVSELAQHVPHDVALVLDDYHVIETPATYQIIEYLVGHTPPTLHVIIATRTDPALPLARLRARGQLCEVRAAQLQFLPEEANTFLQEVMGLDLAAEECAILQQRTEGWIAGLQLAALSLHGQADVPQFLAEFSGSHRHIVDYLTEEVLARQPEAVQSFLLHTALLDRFTSDLCDAVTERHNGEEMLRYLERTNLFIVPLDERRQWYRYHHLFAELLQARLLRQVGTVGYADLYRRASVWYEQGEMPALAVETALAANDFDRAARFLIIDAPLIRSMLAGFGARTLIRWLECFPQEVRCTNAHLCLIYAVSLGTSETSDAYEAPLAIAERLFAAEGHCRGMGMAAALRSLTAMERGDGAQAIKYGAQAIQLLPADALLERSLASTTLAGGFRLLGEIAEVRRIVSVARPLHEQSGNVPSSLEDQIALGDLLVMQGNLHEAAARYESVRISAGDRQNFAIQAMLGLGNILLERNELDEAAAHLTHVINFAKQRRDTLRLTRAMLLHARIIQAGGGSAPRLREAWTAAVELAQTGGYFALIAQAQAYQARSWLRQGQMAAVTSWQKANPYAYDAPPDYQYTIIALTHVRVLLAQGETKTAVAMLVPWQRHARAQGRFGDEIELLALSALAYAQHGKAEQAVHLLQQALLLAAPEGYTRVFLDEGVPMAVLFQMALARSKRQTGGEEVRRVLVAFEAEQAAAGSPALTTPQREPPLTPLSDRERHVLRGLAAGLSNAEIAAELMVSINTIRTQARSIYHKLNAKNRHEAVTLARQWRLF